MTSGSRTGSGPADDEFARESHRVTIGKRTIEIARYLMRHAIPKTKGGWLGDAAQNWDTLYVSAEVPGAPAPKVARNTLTREAHQRRWNRTRDKRRAEFLTMLGLV